jgi:hypothetical protein
MFKNILKHFIQQLLIVFKKAPTYFIYKTQTFELNILPIESVFRKFLKIPFQSADVNIQIYRKFTNLLDSYTKVFRFLIQFPIFFQLNQPLATPLNFTRRMKFPNSRVATMTTRIHHQEATQLEFGSSLV